MDRELLIEVEKRIANTLREVEDVQFSMERVATIGETILSIKLKQTSISNKCPNFSDSSNDCEHCEFASDWHLVEGRCVPKDKSSGELSYGNLKGVPLRLLNIRLINRKRKRKVKVNVAKKREEFEAKAVWV